MTKRMMLIVVAVFLLAGITALLYPIVNEQMMINRLQSSDQRAFDALIWLANKRGAAGLALAYSHGSPYTKTCVPEIVRCLLLHKRSYYFSLEKLRGCPLSTEEAFTLLLQGLQTSDQNAASRATFALGDIQKAHHIITAQNISRLLPFLQDTTLDRSELWDIIRFDTDPAILGSVPDATLLAMLNHASEQQACDVLGALEHKYAMQPVRWKWGVSGFINMPNILLLALMQSPCGTAQSMACQQLEANYLSVATHSYLALPTCDPLHGSSISLACRYTGPPLRKNRTVEQAIGLSTEEVIHTLDNIRRAHLPEASLCWYSLRLVLTGER